MKRETYTITSGKSPDNGRLMHYIRTSGVPVTAYRDDRPINAASDSHDIVLTACDKLDSPEPDFVEHDGEYIHFGYDNNDQ